MANSERKDVATARDATWLFIMNIVTAISGVVYFSFAARILPSSVELGILTFVTMIVMLLNTFGVFALPQAAVKFLAELRGKENIEGGRAFFKLLTVAGLLCALGSAVLLLLLSGLLSLAFLGNLQNTLYLNLLALDIIPVILKNFFHRSLIGQQRIRQAGIAGIVGGMLRATLSILFLLGGFGISGIIIGWVIGNSVDAILCFLWSSRGYFGVGKTAVPRQDLISFTGPLYFSNILNYLNVTTDRFLLLLLLGVSALGVYSPALAAFAIISLLPTSISTALFPRFSEISAKASTKTTRNAARMAYRWLYLVFLPVSFGVALESAFIIEIIAGSAYLDAAPILSLLAIALGLTCPTAVFGSILMGQGKTRVLFISKGMVFAAGLVASLILIIPLQLVGAALAKITMLSVEFIFISIVLWKSGDIDFSKSALLKPLMGSIITVLILYIFQLFWSSFWLLPIYLVVGIGIYLLSLRLMRTVTHDDIDFIGDFMPSKMKNVVDLFGRVLVSSVAIERAGSEEENENHL